MDYTDVYYKKDTDISICWKNLVAPTDVLNTCNNDVELMGASQLALTFGAVSLAMFSMF
jgi:hypothetical protein